MKWQRWVMIGVAVCMTGCVPMIDVHVETIHNVDSNVTTVTTDEKITNGVEAFNL